MNKFVYWVERKDFTESQLEDMIICYRKMKEHLKWMIDHKFNKHSMSLKIIQWGSSWDVSGVIFCNKNDKEIKHPLTTHFPYHKDNMKIELSELEIDNYDEQSLLIDDDEDEND